MAAGEEQTEKGVTGNPNLDFGPPPSRAKPSNGGQTSKVRAGMRLSLLIYHLYHQIHGITRSALALGTSDCGESVEADMNMFRLTETDSILG